MKDLPIVPRAVAAPFDWKSSMWPLMAGAGVLGYLMMGLLQKDRKMTKLEKACVAFVIAIGEKVEELEKINARLTRDLGESISKKQHEELEQRAEELERKVADITTRAERAEKKVIELEVAAAAAAASKRRAGR